MRENRQEELRAKMAVQHPLYPWLKVDMRTQAEVEESRTLKARPPIPRRARTAKRRGRTFNVQKDTDGAFRLTDRLDRKYFSDIFDLV